MVSHSFPQSSNLTSRFEMPEIPDDWRPRPARVWGTTRQWDELPGTVAPEKEVIRGAPGRPLTFEQVSTTVLNEEVDANG